jgi:hypothetical protein
VRRTWSVRGHAPILRHRFGWKKASMAAALDYRPDGTAAGLCFHLQQPSDNTDTSSASWTSSPPSTPPAGGTDLGRAERALEHPDAGLSGQPARLALCRAAPRLCPRAQPGRVPYANLKDVELANFAGDTIAEVVD